MASRGGKSGEAGGRPSARRLRGPWWFPERRELSDEQRRHLLAQLYFHGPDRRPFLGRFAALLVFSLLIAVFGLAEDSAPVVIGAMLVSPLTTPLLGLAGGLVMGWPLRQLESLAILVAATAGGIAVAWLALKLIPEPAALTLTSGELLARTEPRLLDLGVALVAGGAGAYVLVRREAIGALPGVAIAVSLVPPLATAGMMLELGEPGRAGDAFLLYLTNLAGVVLAAAAVMLATGARPREPAERGGPAGLGLAAAGLAVLAVAVPLGAVTAERTQDAIDHDDAVELAREWLAGTGIELREARVEEGSVHLVLVGPERPPALDPLAAKLADALDERVALSVDWTRAKRLEAVGGP